RKHGRSRISLRTVAADSEPPTERKVSRHRVVRSRIAIPETPDSLRPLARRTARVPPFARMRVEVDDTAGAPSAPPQDLHQRAMLPHVADVARMESMAVVGHAV